MAIVGPGAKSDGRAPGQGGPHNPNPVPDPEMLVAPSRDDANAVLNPLEPRHREAQLRVPTEDIDLSPPPSSLKIHDREICEACRKLEIATTNPPKKTRWQKLGCRISQEMNSDISSKTWHRLLWGTACGVFIGASVLAYFVLDPFFFTKKVPPTDLTELAATAGLIVTSFFGLIVPSRSSWLLKRLGVGKKGELELLSGEYASLLIQELEAKKALAAKLPPEDALAQRYIADCKLGIEIATTIGWLQERRYPSTRICNETSSLLDQTLSQYYDSLATGSCEAKTALLKVRKQTRPILAGLTDPERRYQRFIRWTNDDVALFQAKCEAVGGFIDQIEQVEAQVRAITEQEQAYHELLPDHPRHTLLRAPKEVSPTDPNKLLRAVGGNQPDEQPQELQARQGTDT